MNHTISFVVHAETGRFWIVRISSPGSIPTVSAHPSGSTHLTFIGTLHCVTEKPNFLTPSSYITEKAGFLINNSNGLFLQINSINLSGCPPPNSIYSSTNFPSTETNKSPALMPTCSHQPAGVTLKTVIGGVHCVI